jgi:peptidoglycan hydrolase-like protein with peptidoglycan-binding domain
MTETTVIVPGAEGPAVRDVQERLMSLGYDLEHEAASAVFGPATARAVMAFREYAGLVPGESIDHVAWKALVNATFTFGDRMLYLRIPYFHGHDVQTLQTALAALGFSCATDGIFGGHTERAVREFQHNAGIGGDGIVGDSTFSAIKRLRHAWEGKEGLAFEGQTLGFARAAEVLEGTAICIYGTDDATRGVAERISNLAQATTATSLVTSVPSPELVPTGPGPLLVIQLASLPAPDGAERQEPASQHPEPAGQVTVPQVIYDNDATINARMATAIRLTTGSRPRITVFMGLLPREGEKLLVREEQHAAVVLLDALCLACA